MRPGVRQFVAAVGVFTVATIVFTWPLVLNLPTALPSDLGDPLLNTWILGWDADRLRHGLRGLWNAPNFFPHPLTLTFSEHLLGIALIVAPLEWIGRNPVLAYNAAFLMAFIVAGVGMYLLAFSLTGRHDAAIVAGLAYAFCPYRMAQLSRLQVLWSGWLPVALWGLHRYFQSAGRRWLAICAGALLLQWLSNSYFVYISAPAVLLVVVFEWSRRPQAARRVVIPDLLIAAAALIVAMAPIVWTYYTARRALHLVRSLDEIRMYGADVGAYLHADSAIRWWRHLPGVAMIEGDLFPGLTVCILSGIALWRWREGAAIRRLYLAIGACGFIVSLGPQLTVWRHVVLHSGPYAWLMTIVPGLDGLRVPARFGVLVTLSLAVLAAAGLSRIQQHLRSSMQRVCAIALALLVFLEGYGGPIPLIAVPHEPDDERTYALLRASGRGGVVEFPIQRPMSFSPLAYPERGPAAFLNTRYQYETLVHGHPIVNGFSGYEPLVNVLLRRVIEEHDLRSALQMLRSLGVRYAIVHPPDGSIQRLAPVTAAQILAESDQVQGAYALGSTTTIALKPWAPIVPPVAKRRVTREGFRTSVSARADRLEHMLDGDIGSRWFSGRAQDGTEWICVHFARALDLGVVHVEQGISITDYPRELRIEASSGAAEPTTVLFEGSVVPQLGQGLVRDPQRAPIDIVLPHNRTAILWIRQTGTTAVWPWSIHELEFWERAESFALSHEDTKPQKP